MQIFLIRNSENGILTKDQNYLFRENSELIYAKNLH